MKLVYCNYCKKLGHFKKDCQKNWLRTIQMSLNRRKLRRRPPRRHHSSGAEGKGDWLVDSGATCHMFNDK